MKRIYVHFLFWCVMLVFFALLFVPVGCGGDGGNGGESGGETGTVAGKALDTNDDTVDGAICRIITNDGNCSNISSGDAWATSSWTDTADYLKRSVMR